MRERFEFGQTSARVGGAPRTATVRRHADDGSPSSSQQFERLPDRYRFRPSLVRDPSVQSAARDRPVWRPCVQYRRTSDPFLLGIHDALQLLLRVADADGLWALAAGHRGKPGNPRWGVRNRFADCKPADVIWGAPYHDGRRPRGPCRDASCPSAVLDSRSTSSRMASSVPVARWHRYGPLHDANTECGDERPPRPPRRIRIRGPDGNASGVAALEVPFFLTLSSAASRDLSQTACYVQAFGAVAFWNVLMLLAVV